MQMSEEKERPFSRSNDEQRDFERNRQHGKREGQHPVFDQVSAERLSSVLMIDAFA